ncbi:MAG: hypothetical protein JNL30_04470, partial [Rubrivivax sp.]|nr:hypothetical protein [Rubrivivax sp.]
GSPVARTGTAGQFINGSRTRYEPYGAAAAGTLNPDGVGFTGHVNDVDTGLVYMQQRYYEPLVGRFLSVDPVNTDLQTGSGFNRYAYANNSPYRYTDPTGRWPFRLRGDDPTGIDLRLAGSRGVGDMGSPESNRQGLSNTLGDRAGVYALAGLMAATTFGGAYSAMAGATAAAAAATTAAKVIANPVPSTMARVIPNGTPATMLGRPGAGDVFVTGASDIAGMGSKQLARRLTIAESPAGYKVIEFAAPRSGVASPVLRSDPGFVGGGRTAGGAREFVVPNGPIPADAVIRIVP